MRKQVINRPIKFLIVRSISLSLVHSLRQTLIKLLILLRKLKKKKKKTGFIIPPVQQFFDMVDVPRTRPTRFYLHEIPLPSKPGLLLSTTSKHTNYGGTKQCVREPIGKDRSFLVHRDLPPCRRCPNERRIPRDGIVESPRRFERFR